MTSPGERPQLMKIMSGMLQISAHSLETMMVSIFLLLINMQLIFRLKWWRKKNKIDIFVCVELLINSEQCYHHHTKHEGIPWCLEDEDMSLYNAFIKTEKNSFSQVGGRASFWV